MHAHPIVLLTLLVGCLDCGLCCLLITNLSQPNSPAARNNRPSHLQDGYVKSSMSSKSSGSAAEADVNCEAAVAWLQAAQSAGNNKTMPAVRAAQA
jgi:hypothetical protein